MSTRSNIGVEINGVVKAVYCHFDGYLSGVGETLVKNYPTRELAEQVVNLGHLSSLYANSGTPPEGHSYENKFIGYTVAYHRDRGEPLGCNSYVTRQQYLEDTRDDVFIEYTYLWDDEHGWMVFSKYLDIDEFVPFDEAMRIEEEMNEEYE